MPVHNTTYCNNIVIYLYHLICFYLASSNSDEFCCEVQPTWSGFVEASPRFVYLHHQHSPKLSGKRLSRNNTIFFLHTNGCSWLTYVFLSYREADAIFWGTSVKSQIWKSVGCWCTRAVWHIITRDLKLPTAQDTLWYLLSTHKILEQLFFFLYAFFVLLIRMYVCWFFFYSQQNINFG